MIGFLEKLGFLWRSEGVGNRGFLERGDVGNGGHGAIAGEAKGSEGFPSVRLNARLLRSACSPVGALGLLARSRARLICLTVFASPFREERGKFALRKKGDSTGGTG